jgi:hypothetical protein
MDWIDLAQDREQWRALVYTVMNKEPERKEQIAVVKRRNGKKLLVSRADESKQLPIPPLAA